MNSFSTLSEKIKTLKMAREILHEEYQNSDFHKKKEANPQDYVPSAPEDEDVIKLLSAIQQIDQHIKKLQDEQFKVLKEHNGN